MQDGRPVVGKTLGEGKLHVDLLDENVLENIPCTKDLHNKKISRR